MKKVMNEIEPKRFYSAGEIVRLGLIPGCNTTPIATRLIQSDLRTNNWLKGMRVTRGVNGVMYQVQGKNIINFLVQRESQNG